MSLMLALMACQPDSVALSNPAMRTISAGDFAIWPTKKYLITVR